MPELKKVSAPKNQVPRFNEDGDLILDWICGVSETAEHDAHRIHVNMSIAGLTKEQIVFHAMRDFTIKYVQPELRALGDKKLAELEESGEMYEVDIAEAKQRAISTGREVDHVKRAEKAVTKMSPEQLDHLEKLILAARKNK